MELWIKELSVDRIPALEGRKYGRCRWPMEMRWRAGIGPYYTREFDRPIMQPMRWPFQLLQGKAPQSTCRVCSLTSATPSQNHSNFENSDDRCFLQGFQFPSSWLFPPWFPREFHPITVGRYIPLARTIIIPHRCIVSSSMDLRTLYHYSRI